MRISWEHLSQWQSSFARRQLAFDHKVTNTPGGGVRLRSAGELHPLDVDANPFRIRLPQFVLIDVHCSHHRSPTFGIFGIAHGVLSFFLQLERRRKRLFLCHIRNLTEPVYAHSGTRADRGGAAPRAFEGMRLSPNPRVKPLCGPSCLGAVQYFSAILKCAFQAHNPCLRAGVPTRQPGMDARVHAGQCDVPLLQKGGHHERTPMGTLPIECGGEVGRISVQEGSIGRDRTQADGPGARGPRNNCASRLSETVTTSFP